MSAKTGHCSKCGETDLTKFSPKGTYCRACSKFYQSHSTAVQRRHDLVTTRMAAREEEKKERKRVARAATTQSMRDHIKAIAQRKRHGIKCSCECSDRCRLHAPPLRKWSRESYSSRAWQMLKERLLMEQSGRCAACRTDSPGVDRTGRVLWHLDHNDETGVVRGVLCMACNTAFGLLRHNIARFHSGIAYLRAHEDLPRDVTIDVPTNVSKRRRIARNAPTLERGAQYNA